MAKKKSEEITPMAEGVDTPPEGFVELSTDLEAFWDFSGSVMVIPLGYTLSDPKDRKKPAILVHCELVKSRALSSPENGEPVHCEAGARIGIWYKPGLRNLMNCGGKRTFMAFKRLVDVGQIEPMKQYTVAPEGSAGERIQCLGDYRKFTRNMRLPWESSEVNDAPARRASGAAPADDSDTPF